MVGYDAAVLWILVLLLCFISLTTRREWWQFFRGLYRHAIDVWKRESYDALIGGSRQKRKHASAPDSELGTHYHSKGHKSIFPRSRRSTS